MIGVVILNVHLKQLSLFSGRNWFAEMILFYHQVYLKEGHLHQSCVLSSYII